MTQDTLLPEKRISLSLPASIEERLAVQVDCFGMGRRDLIVLAITWLLDQFEAIDAEHGRPCTCGLLDFRGDRRRGRLTDVHSAGCRWSPPDHSRARCSSSDQ